MNLVRYVFHFVLYNISWLAAIIFAAQNNFFLATAIIGVLTIIQIIWEFHFYPSKNLIYRIIILSSVGILIDSLLLWFHIIVFAANPFSPYLSPPWMMMIWINFSVVLFATLSSLFKNKIKLGILSFFAFAAAYAFGVKMGAANFTHGYKTAILIGAIWAFCLPLCVHLALKRKPHA